MNTKKLFFLICLILSSETRSQVITKFIEPNISIEFDSKFFKINERYSNTFWETESYDFQYIYDTTFKTNITINTSFVDETESMNNDTIIKELFSDSIKKESENLSDIRFDSVVNHINKFSCFGFSALNKMSNNEFCIIAATKRIGELRSDITLISNLGNKTKNYKVLTTFLFGIKSYSDEQIKAEEDKILKSYTVLVEKFDKDVEQFNYRPKTFVGIVKVKEPLKHKLLQVLLYRNGVEEVFEPQKDANIYIVTNDKTKGEVNVKCKLVVLNSFGKKVKIPFEFKYTN